MNYINTYKRLLVNSVNQISKKKLIFDFDTTQFYGFRLLDKEGKQIELKETDDYYICGSLKNSAEDTIFFSREFNIVGNVLTFKISGNTTEFLEKVTDRNTNIFIEIGRKTTADQTFKVILMDQAFANNRLYVQGMIVPLQIDKFYTKSEVDKLLEDIEVGGTVEETDPIYSADKPTLALKSELFSKSYNDLTDKPTNFQEMGISITTDDIISNYGAGEDLTTELGNIENNMWWNVEQQLKNYVKTVQGAYPDEDGNITLTGTYIYSINNSLYPEENGNVNGVVTSVNGTAPDEFGNVELQGAIFYSILGDFATTIAETTFSTEYIWNVTEESYVSDLLLEIMTRFDADQGANAIRHQEFDTRLTELENTSSGTSNLTVNNISPDENGNIVLTTDEIVSNFYGNGDNLTTELANIENNMWQNVEQEFNNRNYIKTISGLSADENGDVAGIVTTVNNIPADDQWGNLWLFSTDIQHNSPEQSVGQVLDDLTAKIGDIESVLDAINGEVI